MRTDKPNVQQHVTNKPACTDYKCISSYARRPFFAVAEIYCPCKRCDNLPMAAQLSLGTAAKSSLTISSLFHSNCDTNMYVAKDTTSATMSQDNLQHKCKELLGLHIVSGQSFFNDLCHFCLIKQRKGRLMYAQVCTVGRLRDFLNVRLCVGVFLCQQSSPCSRITQQHSSSTHITKLLTHIQPVESSIT